jgi:hypothetical protein
MGFPMRSEAGLLDGFRALSEYECGRAQMAIEWVARSQKPVVEIGGRPSEGCDFVTLAADLNQCIAHSGEAVSGFIIPDKLAGYCCYGFYRYPWAIEALLDVWEIERAPEGTRSLWRQGLVFGYSPEAIQTFISSASCERESTLHSRRYIEIFRLYKVEIYGPLASLAQHHSSLSDRCQRLR